MKNRTVKIFVTIILILPLVSFTQNTLPVAVNDSIILYLEDPFGSQELIYNVVLNDYDPEEEPVEIFEVRRQGYDNQPVLFNDSSVIVNTSSYPNLIERIYFYRIRRKSDTTAISNWARLYTNPSGGPDWPVARADTVFITRWHTSEINLLENDLHPLGNSSHIAICYDGTIVSDSIARLFGDPMSFTSSYNTEYILTDTSGWWNRFDVGLIHVQLSNNRFYDSLDLNNINARFYCFGHHFWDFDARSCFFAPGNSRITSIFNQAFWIGGLDEQGDLHVAAERYRASGADFYHGPVSVDYDSLYDIRWYHIWNLSRAEVEYHKVHWNDPGYEPIEDILSWPGNGDTTKGQAEQIAPFEDLNGNGIYEPLAGDFPKIKGDQSLFFVFNDDRYPHLDSDGTPLGIEVRAMAYAFDAPEDSVLWNTIFLHYDIVNRSDTTYHDVYLGVFTDTDLGFAWDDRIESDVMNGMYFTYNGHENDPENYYNPGYGDHPPAQGIMMLGGPYMEPNGVDDPRLDNLGNQILNESINGLNFGDGIIDNERLGMHTFHYFNGGGFGPGNDPQHAPSYYNYLRGLWLDGMPMSYGGFGHPNAGSVGPECRYWCPRDSDPYNWGTYGLWPNPPYNPDNYFWSDEQEGFNPNDRRGLGTMGPFTFAPGQSQPLDLAFPWARDYDGTAWESALLLKERAAQIRELFQTDSIFISGSRIPPETSVKLKIQPNPTARLVRIKNLGENSPVQFFVIDIIGDVKISGETRIMDHSLEIDLSELPAGSYIIKIKTGNQLFTAPILKI